MIYYTNKCHFIFILLAADPNLFISKRADNVALPPLTTYILMIAPLKEEHWCDVLTKV